MVPDTKTDSLGLYYIYIMYILCIHYIHISYTLYKKILVPETKTDSLGLHMYHKYLVPDKQKLLSGTSPRDQN